MIVLISGVDTPAGAEPVYDRLAVVLTLTLGSVMVAVAPLVLGVAKVTAVVPLVDNGTDVVSACGMELDGIYVFPTDPPPHAASIAAAAVATKNTKRALTKTP
ncbi:MAG TPA: hypothetical protein VMF11_09425 [Candidatus Baltobacteraceae bacterium]|nr:hypothetical protein [Candidatus Baltobacteraceae bacterium]